MERLSRLFAVGTAIGPTVDQWKEKPGEWRRGVTQVKNCIPIVNICNLLFRIIIWIILERWLDNLMFIESRLGALTTAIGAVGLQRVRRVLSGRRPDQVAVLVPVVGGGGRLQFIGLQRGGLLQRCLLLETQNGEPGLV